MLKLALGCSYATLDLLKLLKFIILEKTLCECDGATVDMLMFVVAS